jgi:hypothetical protein
MKDQAPLTQPRTSGVGKRAGGEILNSRLLQEPLLDRLRQDDVGEHCQRYQCQYIGGDGVDVKAVVNGENGCHIPNIITIADSSSMDQLTRPWMNGIRFVRMMGMMMFCVSGDWTNQLDHNYDARAGFQRRRPRHDEAGRVVKDRPNGPDRENETREVAKIPGVRLGDPFRVDGIYIVALEEYWKG